MSEVAPDHARSLHGLGSVLHALATITAEVGPLDPTLSTTPLRTEVETLRTDRYTLEAAIQAVVWGVGPQALSVQTTPYTDLLLIRAYDPAAYADPGALLDAVMDWLAHHDHVRYRVQFGLCHATILELEYPFASVNDMWQERAPALVQAARDVHLCVTPFVDRKLAAVPPCAGEEDAPDWSFDDVRTACRMEAARPALVAALGGMAADRVLSFAAPALPLRVRLAEEEARLRRKRPADAWGAGRDGDRPPTETPAPASAPASLDADLGLRVAERRGQDLAAQYL
jgi:hypothetical protein